MSNTAIRMLLVEDHIIGQKAVTWLLNAQGCTVDIADTGAAALAKVTECVYDVIFMDVGLPDMDGLQVAAHIRAGETPNKESMIVFLSAYPEEQYTAHIERLGNAYFLEKPATPEKCREILQLYRESVIVV